MPRTSQRRTRDPISPEVIASELQAGPETVEVTERIATTEEDMDAEATEAAEVSS